MKRLSLPAIVALLLLVAPQWAFGYVPSKQYGAFELKFGPYTPNVDDEPSLGGQTVYADTFEDESMFLTVLELDWQFFRFIGGSVGIGGSWGFMQAYNKARSVTGAVSSDYTVLNVMPFALLAVLRVDALADNAAVPLVPYVKAGPCWYYWWILGGGNVADEANGGTLGWQVSTGLMLRLDPFDQMAARTFDNEIGVNHSYLFFELMWANVEGVGNNNMHLSPTDLSGLGNATFMIGLALEF